MKNEITHQNIEPTTVMDEAGKDLIVKSDIQCKNHESSEDVPDPTDLDKTKKNLMISDDLQLVKQNTREKYLIKGRQCYISLLAH